MATRAEMLWSLIGKPNDAFSEAYKQQRQAQAKQAEIEREGEIKAAAAEQAQMDKIAEELRKAEQEKEIYARTEAGTNEALGSAGLRKILPSPQIQVPTPLQAPAGQPDLTGPANALGAYIKGQPLPSIPQTDLSKVKGFSLDQGLVKSVTMPPSASETVGKLTDIEKATETALAKTSIVTQKLLPIAGSMRDIKEEIDKNPQAFIEMNESQRKEFGPILQSFFENPLLGPELQAMAGKISGSPLVRKFTNAMSLLGQQRSGVAIPETERKMYNAILGMGPKTTPEDRVAALNDFIRVNSELWESATGAHIDQIVPSVKNRYPNPFRPIEWKKKKLGPKSTSEMTEEELSAELGR